MIGLADLDHGHPIGLLVELLQVLDVLRVVDQEVIVADVVAELFLGRGERRSRRGLEGGGLLRLGRRHADGDRQSHERDESLEHRSLAQKKGSDLLRQHTRREDRRPPFFSRARRPCKWM
jgi:hypothetical protein